MFLALALMLGAAQVADASIVRELEQIEQRLADTWQTGNCSAWGDMLSPDWSVTHITGERMTKVQALEECKAPRTGTETLKVDDVVVRVFQQAAVVTGRTTVSIGGATPGAVALRFTDVFIRVKGRWRVVASHATRLPS